MLTLKVQEEEPQRFVAVHVTVVVPTGKLLPEAGEQVAVISGTPPEGAVNVSVIPPALEVPSLISPGQVITGA
jgi:hypothetical protein